MAISKAHLAPRIVALRRLRCSYGLIALRLGCTVPYVAQVLAARAPELRLLVASYSLKGI